MIVALVIGMLIGTGLSTQSIVIAAASRSLGIWGASFLSFLTGVILLAIPMLWTSQISVKRIAPSSLWLLAVGGGVIGGLMVVGRTWLIPRVGTANAMVYVVAGQLLSSVVLDHFGLLGVQPKPLSLIRVCGVALLLAGMLVILYTKPDPIPSHSAMTDQSVALIKNPRLASTTMTPRRIVRSDVQTEQRKAARPPRKIHDSAS